MIPPASDRPTAEERARRAFVRQFSSAPAHVVRAPGRVNLIGEHTDYNDGFVLPMAIDRAVWMAVRPTAERMVRVYSDDFGEWCDLPLGRLTHGGPGWAEYIKGVAWALQEEGVALGGWEGVLAGDVPMGAGLSSSAAVELAAARVFATVSGLTWEPSRMARTAQRAEHDWVGMRCGIMDQLVIAAAQADHALLIDCRTLALSPVPLPPGSAVLVLDTLTRRGLTDSPYNERRRQCEEAASSLGVPALRDVGPAMLEEGRPRLEAIVARRARHVVSENERVQQAVDALRRGDAAACGRLMDESHRSLRDDFEVSSPAVDAMVACARDAGCYGARMTGGGFGGCAVALIDAEKTKTFTARVSEAYRLREGRVPAVYVCRATDGASVSVSRPSALG